MNNLRALERFSWFNENTVKIIAPLFQLCKWQKKKCNHKMMIPWLIIIIIIFKKNFLPIKRSILIFFCLSPLLSVRKHWIERVKLTYMFCKILLLDKKWSEYICKCEWWNLDKSLAWNIYQTHIAHAQTIFPLLCPMFAKSTVRRFFLYVIKLR